MHLKYESWGPKPLTPPAKDLKYLEQTILCFIEQLRKGSNVERGFTSPSVEGSAPE